MTAMLPVPGGVATAQIVSGFWILEEGLRIGDDERLAVRGLLFTAYDRPATGQSFLRRGDDDDSRRVVADRVGTYTGYLLQLVLHYLKLLKG